MTVRQFAAFEREAGNMLAPLTAIGRDLHAQVAAAFATEGSSGASGHWRVLSEPYRTWKERHGPGAPILVGLRPERKGSRPQTYSVSGRMRYQLLDPLATHVTPRRLLYAPTSDIAGYHETGTGRMPARPPVDLSLTFLHSIDRAFVIWLGALTDRMGLSGPGSGARR